MKNDMLEDFSPTSEVVTADKLTFKLPITALPASSRKKLSGNLKDAVKCRDGKILGTKKKAFKQRYLIPVIQENDRLESVLIEYQPMQPDRAKYAFRLEFNPNKLGVAGCKVVRTIFKEVFSDEFVRLASELVITDVDWCI
ncbi:hypothetical protein [uncultured Herbaspirillum sp.]|uniref:hypothetical protein n=1 Tax=uncultured Herbaspirillum sp. TaxID=160236 RepID=UPI00262EF1A5|nr:hypothetical protein [uncultured Herbaspirillum sp.]